jgi:hypothetical protein
MQIRLIRQRHAGPRAGAIGQPTPGCVHERSAGEPPQSMGSQICATTGAGISSAQTPGRHQLANG